MGRRGSWLVLAASAAAHLALFAAWLSTRPDPAPVESPTMEVQLVRRPPPPAPPRAPAVPTSKAAALPQDKTTSEPRPADPPPTASPPVAPRLLTDEELLAAPRPTARQVRDAPISIGGSSNRPPRPPRPKCKPAEGYPGPPLPCPGELGKDPNRPFDVDRDAPDSDLAREGRYKRAMKAYHEAPGGAGYPGVACAIFHRC